MAKSFDQCFCLLYGLKRLEAERNGDKNHEDHQTAIREVPKPTESEHVRQRDKKPHAGPPSLGQRLAQDRAHRGGERKNPF